MGFLYPSNNSYLSVFDLSYMDRSNELAAVNMVEIQRNEAYGTANVEQRVSAMYEEIDITDQASGHQIDAFNIEANTAYQTQAVVMNQI